MKSRERIIMHRTLALMVDPQLIFATIFAQHDSAFWLDSNRASAGLSRFSYMGNASGPSAEVLSYSVDSGLLSIQRRDSRAVVAVTIFDYIESQLHNNRLDNSHLPFDFCGGFVGYFGYEMKAECGSPNSYQSDHPDASLIFVERFIAIDHQDNTIWMCCVDAAGNEDEVSAWLDDLEKRISGLAPRERPRRPEGTPPVFTMRHSHSDYLESIEVCLSHIREGESYEICLTNTFTTQCAADPIELYQILRSLNPAPFAAFLKVPRVAVLCSSPERFLKLDSQRQIESRPIKGTRTRSANRHRDLEIREELRSCEKDRAENLMIVDLLRNDLGRVSVTGSVHVPALFDVETYETVHQLVSTIRGTLREDRTPIDLLRACFPGGSMTGAPKHRTMKLIDRLEGGPRGIYSGTLGYLSLNGTMDLNIVIRTIVMSGDSLRIGSGGAITALSNAEDEYAEMLLKSQAPMRAVSFACCGDPDRYLVQSAAVSSSAAEPIRIRPSRI
jgi:para-aminobenzoate synthetase